MENKTYELHVAGLTRHLPICKVNDKISFAGFIMFSDVEMTVACAAELIKKCPPCDVLITAESKGIPLAYEMARQMGLKYVVARKGIKVYTIDPIEVTVNSITTANTQKLYLGRDDIEMINAELAQYSESLADRPQIVIANKRDLLDEDADLSEFEAYVAELGYPLIYVSAATGAGLDETGVQKHFKQRNGYTIPYGCLLPEKTENLLLCGRNISGTHIAHSDFRAMPICVGTGEAAGAAAAIAVSTGKNLCEIDAADIRKKVGI